jgi:hypothetical protein
MKILVILLALLISFPSIGQRKKEKPTYLTIEVVIGDTLTIERIPLSELTGDQKYFIDALQKQLDQAKSDIKSDSVVDEVLVSNIDKLIVSIKNADTNWKSENYKNELNCYLKYKTVIQDDAVKQGANYSNTSKTVHTGPRGGKYYINSNGNKTYIKKKN